MYHQTFILLTMCILIKQLGTNSTTENTEINVRGHEEKPELGTDTRERIITTAKYSRFRVRTTIIHGNPVSRGQFPYLVSIKEPVHKVGTDKQLWRNLCGGSILSHLKVLTAAHCFEVRGYHYWAHFDKLRVVAGSLLNEWIHTGHNQTNLAGQWRTIKSLRLHKHFQFPSHDIALVFVSSDFIFTETVNYAIAASVMTDYPRACVAAGYGQTSPKANSNTSKVLRWADISVLSRTQCDVWWELSMNTFVCTNSLTSDVSGGDSGGPLICSGTLDPKEKRSRDLVVGITCGKNFDKTTLFTRVAAYRAWIDSGGLSGCDLCEPSKLIVLFWLFITCSYIRLLIQFTSTF